MYDWAPYDNAKSSGNFLWYTEPAAKPMPTPKPEPAKKHVTPKVQQPDDSGPGFLPFLGTVPLTATQLQPVCLVVDLSRYQGQDTLAQEDLQVRGRNLRLRQEICTLAGIRPPADADAFLLYEILGHQHI